MTGWGRDISCQILRILLVLFSFVVQITVKSIQNYFNLYMIDGLESKGVTIILCWKEKQWIVTIALVNKSVCIPFVV